MIERASYVCKAFALKKEQGQRSQSLRSVTVDIKMCHVLYYTILYSTVLHRNR